jgi:hypothetical protein
MPADRGLLIDRLIESLDDGPAKKESKKLEILGSSPAKISDEDIPF